jgi:cytochrome P450
VGSRIDVFSQAFKVDQYPTYAHLREADPVHRADLGGSRGFWLITRYQDFVSALRDPQTSCSMPSRRPARWI